MKISCQEQLIPGETIAEKWALARDIGFDAIELLGHGDLGLEKRLPELRVAKKDGAAFSSVCVAMGNFIGDADADARQDAITNLKSQLSVMAELGGTGVITPASYGKAASALARLSSPLKADEQRQVVLDAAQELGEHAHGEGVFLLLEPLNRYETNFIHTLAQGVAVCEAVGLPSVCIMADLYHMNIEEADPNQAMRDAASRLAHVHVCDSNRNEPGTGHIDFTAACTALRDIGYDGYLALECGLRAPPETALRNTITTLRAAMR